jgi:hypothetical protein
LIHILNLPVNVVLRDDHVVRQSLLDRSGLVLRSYTNKSERYKSINRALRLEAYPKTIGNL